MEPDCMYEYKYDRSEPFEFPFEQGIKDGEAECEECGDIVDEFELEDGICNFCREMMEEDELDDN